MHVKTCNWCHSSFPLTKNRCLDCGSGDYLITEVDTAGDESKPIPAVVAVDRALLTQALYYLSRSGGIVVPDPDGGTMPHWDATARQTIHETCNALRTILEPRTKREGRGL